MSTKITGGLLLSTVLVLSGCGIASTVGPGAPVKVKNMTLSTPITWNQFGASRMRIWTVDGFSLNALRVLSDIKPGETLFLEPRGRLERRGEGLLFRAGMSELEVQELFVDALKSADAVDVKASQLRPSSFGARPGFRFELRYTNGAGLAMGTRGGLKMRGMVLAETQEDTLSFLMFLAPEEFYFGRDQAAVEQIFSRLQTN